MRGTLPTLSLLLPPPPPPSPESPDRPYLKTCESFQARWHRRGWVFDRVDLRIVVRGSGMGWSHFVFALFV
jgi:hypothetical protein